MLSYRYKYGLNAFFFLVICFLLSQKGERKI